MLPEDSLRRYTRALYPVALLLMLVPTVDLLLRSLPPQFGTLQWRFATAGLLFGNFGTIILGAGLLGLAGVLSGDRKVVRAVGIVALVMAVVTIAGIGLFALDAVQLRQLASANFKRPLLTSSLSALFTASLGLVAWIVIGRAAMAASRPEVSARGRAAAPAPPLVATLGATSRETPPVTTATREAV